MNPVMPAHPQPNQQQARRQPQVFESTVTGRRRKTGAIETAKSVNAERRGEYRAEHPLPEKPCVVCDTPFQRRPDAIRLLPEAARPAKTSSGVSLTECTPSCWRKRKAGFVLRRQGSARSL
jgi:hypothetical protein